MASKLVALHHLEVLKSHQGWGPKGTLITMTGGGLWASLCIKLSGEGLTGQDGERDVKAAGEKEEETQRGER